MSNKMKNKRIKKIITLASVLLAIIIASALIIPGVVSAKNDKKAVQASGEIKTAVVGIQDIRESVSGSGEIVTGDEEAIEVDEDEEIDEVLVEEGQAVKEGDALLTYIDGTEMTAPFKGVISKVSVSDSTEGSSMSAGGSGSITVMSTETLVTELSVDETDLQNIKVGQKAEVTVNALPETQYTGTVTKIGETGEYENGSSKFKIVIKLDKTDKVKIGMSAAVEIVVKSVEGAVAVPIEAVKGSGDNASVMVVGSDGTAVPVSVELGLANDAYVQIVSGLSEGDTIQYTVQSSSDSRSFSGFGEGSMLGQGGGMQGRFGGSDGSRIPGGNMPQSNSK